ncbi:MAG: LD-carboxypeptidase [Syntrophaceae bacterium]|nr:LD-carboxypeptidase [Syntrophaceae bacterium]
MKVIYPLLPSWLVKKKRDFIDGVKSLEKLGFKVLNRRFVTRLPSNRKKADQVHSAFLDKRVEVILAQRGGYSSIKLLPLLDFGMIRKNPKIFAGFSDLSTLLNVLYEKTGLVTLHSPMIVNFPKPPRINVLSFLNAINGFPQKNIFAGAPVRVYHHGSARGILKGGNLATLTSLMGTEWEIETAGSVLFLEDVDEELYRVDRYLTQWFLAGKFRRIKGLILGDFRGLRNREVFKILSTQMKVHFPVVHTPYIGHGKNKITLPVGAVVDLDTFRKSLTLR